MVDVCHFNSLVAESHQRRDISQIWDFTSRIILIETEEIFSKYRLMDELLRNFNVDSII
jgi:hypothetical protein